MRRILSIFCFASVLICVSAGVQAMGKAPESAEKTAPALGTDSDPDIRASEERLRGLLFHPESAKPSPSETASSDHSAPAPDRPRTQTL